MAVFFSSRGTNLSRCFRDGRLWFLPPQVCFHQISPSCWLWPLLGTSRIYLECLELDTDEHGHHTPYLSDIATTDAHETSSMMYPDLYKHKRVRLRHIGRRSQKPIFAKRQDSEDLMSSYGEGTAHVTVHRSTFLVLTVFDCVIHQPAILLVLSKSTFTHLKASVAQHLL